MTVSTTYCVYFGLTENDGTFITEDHFNLFLTQEVCPLLKNYSIRDELGFYNGTPEPTRVLTYITDKYEDALKIHAIASHYKARFNQDTVLVNSYSSVTDAV
jgi:hypothetical protein